ARLRSLVCGPGERYGRQLPMTCLAFAGEDSGQPRAVTLQFPVWAHVRNDEVGLSRMLALLEPEHRGPLEQVARTIARRDLADGVGLIQWIACRSTPAGLRCTCYFAAEANAVWPPRRVAGAIDPVPDRSGGRDSFATER